ncbi:hypothetical protein ES703_62951 [subsurface metagenome]
MPMLYIAKRAGNAIWRWLYVSEDTLRVISIVAMTLLVFVSIMLRLLLATAYPEWDEIARYLMIWSIMAGFIVTSRDDEHIKMGFLRNVFHGRHLLIFDFIVMVITLLFLCIFMVWSYQYILYSVEASLHAFITNIPMAPVHASFVAGAFFSVLHFVVHTVKKGQQLLNYSKTEASC